MTRPSPKPSRRDCRFQRGRRPAWRSTRALRWKAGRLFVSSVLESKRPERLSGFGDSLDHVNAYLDRVTRLNALYRAGDIHAHVPAALHEDGGTLDDLVAQHLPESNATFQA